MPRHAPRGPARTREGTREAPIGSGELSRGGRRRPRSRRGRPGVGGPHRFIGSGAATPARLWSCTELPNRPRATAAQGSCVARAPAHLWSPPLRPLLPKRARMPRRAGCARVRTGTRALLTGPRGVRGAGAPAGCTARTPPRRVSCACTIRHAHRDQGGEIATGVVATPPCRDALANHHERARRRAPHACAARAARTARSLPQHQARPLLHAFFLDDWLHPRHAKRDRGAKKAARPRFPGCISDLSARGLRLRTGAEGVTPRSFLPSVARTRRPRCPQRGAAVSLSWRRSPGEHAGHPVGD